MKQIISILIICSSIIAVAAPKKKLFISSIKNKGISKSLQKEFTNILEVSLITNYGRKYKIKSIDDMKNEMNNLAFRQALGCDSSKCINNLAKTQDADEVIYGEIFRSGNQITISIKNLYRDKKTGLYYRKSLVYFKFSRYYLKWYAQETAKKLINPRYKVKVHKVRDLEKKEISLEELTLEPEKLSSIFDMSFNTDSQLLNGIIKELKSIINDGDIDYKFKRYQSAYDIYNKAYDKIFIYIPYRFKNSKPLKDIERVLKKRLILVLDNIFLKELKKADDGIRKIKSIEDIYIIKKKFNKVERKLSEIKKKNLIYSGNKFKNIIYKRKKYLALNELILYEKKGTENYNRIKFNDALEYYQKAYKEISNIEAKYREYYRKNLYLKITITKRTGQKFLSSKATYLIDQAITINIRGDKKHAKKLLEKARRMIYNNRMFLTYGVKRNYNEAAGIIKVSKLLSDYEYKKKRKLYKKYKITEENKYKEEYDAWYLDTQNNAANIFATIILSPLWTHWPMKYDSSGTVSGVLSTIKICWGILTISFYSEGKLSFSILTGILYGAAVILDIAIGIAVFTPSQKPRLRMLDMDKFIHQKNTSDNEVGWSVIPRMGIIAGINKKYVPVVDGINVVAQYRF